MEGKKANQKRPAGSKTPSTTLVIVKENKGSTKQCSGKAADNVPVAY